MTSKQLLRSSWFAVLLVACAVLLAPGVSAAVDEGSVGFSCQVSDSEGQPIEGAAVNVSIFDSATGGALVYNEEFVNATNERGVCTFNTLGAGGGLSLVEGTQYFLEMSVNGNAYDFNGVPRQGFIAWFGQSKMLSGVVHAQNFLMAGNQVATTESARVASQQEIRDNVYAHTYRPGAGLVEEAVLDWAYRSGLNNRWEVAVAANGDVWGAYKYDSFRIFNEFGQVKQIISLSNPTGVAAYQNHMYLSYGSTVAKYDLEGNEVWSVTPPNTDRIEELAVREGKIVTGSINDRVNVIDVADGTVTDTFVANEQPRAIDYSQGFVYIGVRDNYIQKYSLDGVLAWQYRPQASSYMLEAIEVTLNGNIVSGHSAFEQPSYLVELSPAGSVVRQVEISEGPIHGFKVTPKHFYVASNNKLDKLSRKDGALIWTISVSGGNVDLTSIELSSSGDLYVGNSAGSGYIYKLIQNQLSVQERADISLKQQIYAYEDTSLKKLSADLKELSSVELGYSVQGLAALKDSVVVLGNDLVTQFDSSLGVGWNASLAGVGDVASDYTGQHLVAVVNDTVHKLDTSTGVVLWTHQHSQTIGEVVVSSEGSVFLVGVSPLETDSIKRLDSTGGVVWTAEKSFYNTLGFVVLHEEEDILYVNRNENEITLFNAVTGSLISSYNINNLGGARAITVREDGLIYVSRGSTVSLRTPLFDEVLDSFVSPLGGFNDFVVVNNVVLARSSGWGVFSFGAEQVSSLDIPNYDSIVVLPGGEFATEDFVLANAGVDEAASYTWSGSHDYSGASVTGLLAPDGDGSSLTGVVTGTGNAGSAVSLGVGSEVTGAGDVAIGQDAKAFHISSGGSNIAIGNSARTGATGTTGFGNVAVGFSASAQSGSQNIAIGRSASSNTFNSIAIGPYAVVSGLNSVALGHNIQASGENSWALGKGRTLQRYTNSMDDSLSFGIRNETGQYDIFLTNKTGVYSMGNKLASEDFVLANAGGAEPAGAVNSLQFNDAGSFNGTDVIRYNPSWDGWIEGLEYQSLIAGFHGDLGSHGYGYFITDADYDAELSLYNNSGNWEFNAMADQARIGRSVSSMFVLNKEGDSRLRLNDASGSFLLGFGTNLGFVDRFKVNNSGAYFAETMGNFDKLASEDFVLANAGGVDEAANYTWTGEHDYTGATLNGVVSGVGSASNIIQLGNDAQAISGGIAIGRESLGGYNGVAIGFDSYAFFDGFAGGTHSNAEQKGVAIGHNVSSINSVALGSDISNTQSNSFLTGASGDEWIRANTTGIYSMGDKLATEDFVLANAGGSVDEAANYTWTGAHDYTGATLSGVVTGTGDVGNSITLGNNAENFGSGGIAIGPSTSIAGSGSSAIALGWGAIAGGQNSYVIGTQMLNSQPHSFVTGATDVAWLRANATGAYADSFVLPNGATVSDNSTCLILSSPDGSNTASLCNGGAGFQ